MVQDLFFFFSLEFQQSFLYIFLISSYRLNQFSQSANKISTYSHHSGFPYLYITINTITTFFSSKFPQANQLLYYSKIFQVMGQLT